MILFNIPPSTTRVQHLCVKLQRKNVNEYNADCFFETQRFAIPGTKYIISMAVRQAGCTYLASLSSDCLQIRSRSLLLLNLSSRASSLSAMLHQSLPRAILTQFPLKFAIFIHLLDACTHVCPVHVHHPFMLSHLFVHICRKLDARTYGFLPSVGLAQACPNKTRIKTVLRAKTCLVNKRNQCCSSTGFSLIFQFQF